MAKIFNSISLSLFFYKRYINLEAARIILPVPNYASENISLDSITLRKKYHHKCLKFLLFI